MSPINPCAEMVKIPQTDATSDADVRSGLHLWRVAILALVLVASVGFATTVLAVIQDDEYGVHSYGGYTCSFAGSSALANPGGSNGTAVTVIGTPSCTNGYRELRAQARTTTNGYLNQYLGWQTYDLIWSFSGRTDLCIVGATIE
jgi:hypothetical protein